VPDGAAVAEAPGSDAVGSPAPGVEDGWSTAEEDGVCVPSPAGSGVTVYPGAVGPVAVDGEGAAVGVAALFTSMVVEL